MRILFDLKEYEKYKNENAIQWFDEIIKGNSKEAKNIFERLYFAAYTIDYAIYFCLIDNLYKKFQKLIK